MLGAYIDDSGSGNPPAFVLAGWVSRDQFWETFSDQWQSALSAIPSIRYFKMHEAHRLEGEFRGWNEEVRDHKLESLLAVIKGHAIFGIHLAIPYAPYQVLFTDKFARQLNRPYVLGFYFVMIELLGFLHLSQWPERADFVFDEQGIDATYALAAYEMFTHFAPPELKPLIGARPIHRTDFELLPLQAADLLAWQTRRFYAEREQNREYSSWVWRWLNRHLGILSYEITEERLRGLVNGIRKVSRLEQRLFPYDQHPPRKKHLGRKRR